MERRRLGRTGLAVSALSLGTVEIGLEYGIVSDGEAGKPDETQAGVVLNTALEVGINLLDTARAYGEAEAIIGRTLGHRRGEFYLVSKVIARPGSPELVRQSIEESLRALQTDHVDVMLIHCKAESDLVSDTVDELMRCRDAGLIRFAGASIYGEPAALLAIRSSWCDCIEIAYSALDRRPEAHVLAEAARHDVGVLARSVLLKGALTRRCRALPEDYRPLKDAVESLLAAAQIGIEELPELSYRYVLSQSPPHSVLAGTAVIDELRKCAAYAGRGPLAGDVLAKLRGVAMPGEEWLHPGMWPKLSMVL